MLTEEAKPGLAMDVTDQLIFNTKRREDLTATVKKQACLVHLVSQGRTVTEAARELGLDCAQSYLLYRKAMRESPEAISKTVEAHRATELARLETLYAKLEDIVFAEGTDEQLVLKTASKMIQLMERKSRLLGLDKPVTVHITAAPDPRPLSDFYAKPDNIVSEQ